MTKPRKKHDELEIEIARFKKDYPRIEINSYDNYAQTPEDARVLSRLWRIIKILANDN